MADLPACLTRQEPRTAREIIERRLGRPLGPLATMPADMRRALYLLALRLVRKNHA